MEQKKEKKHYRGVPTEDARNRIKDTDFDLLQIGWQTSSRSQGDKNCYQIFSPWFVTEEVQRSNQQKR